MNDRTLTYRLGDTFMDRFRIGISDILCCFSYLLLIFKLIKIVNLVTKYKFYASRISRAIFKIRLLTV